MMGPDTLMNASSSPPIYCDYVKTTNNGINTCQAKETSSATTAAMFCTKLRKHFTQIKNQTTHHGRRHQYQKLSSVPNAAAKTTSTTRSRLSSLMNLITITTLILSTFLTTASANPVFVDNPSLAQFQSGRNIRHLPCIVRKSGRSGVCMFAIDCIKQNGTHLGTCIDRFYFGSCCDIKDEGSLFAPEIGDNSIDQNTISHHFTSESTTMPTSALFKLTTLGPHQDSNTTLQQQTQTDMTQISNSVTQSFTSLQTLQDTRRPTITHQASDTTVGTNSPKVPQTTSRPTQSTTHKHSHFVIRTTAKPSKGTTGAKPSYNTTTKKKKITTTTSTSTSTTTTTTTTTTARPILTTTSSKVAQDEFNFEITTPPTKLFTFQTVETTVATPTELTKITDFITTERMPPKSTKSPRPTATTSIDSHPPSTASQRPTMKPKPQTSRKPPTTKKPNQNKRTTQKPSTKPTTEQLKPQTQNTTTSSVTTPSSSTTSSTSTIVLSSTTSNGTVTKYPNGYRPKPKPTATVTKIPKPTATAETSIKPRPTKPTTTTPEELSTTEASKRVQSTTTASTTISSTSSTTKRPQTTTPKSTTVTTSTAASKTEPTDAPLPMSTTLKPGLVTWTNIDAEPAGPNKAADSDWMPVTTSRPSVNNKTNESNLDSNTYEEIGVSVSTSISAVVNNNTIFVSQPQKPIIFQSSTSSTTTTTRKPTTTTRKTTTTTTTTTTPKPTTTTTTTTTTRRPSTTTTTTTTTTRRPSTTTTTPEPTTTTTTTPRPSTTTTTTTTKPTTSTSFPIPITEMPSLTSTIAPPPQSSSSDTPPIVEMLTTDSPSVNATTPANNLEGVDYRQVCGRRMFPEPRIVGGSNAAFGRWPWQISLRQWRTSTYLHKCGAALLNENWAITAAHCVDNVPPSDLLLRLGEYDLAEEEEPYGYQERRVQIVASHPQFDPRTFEYDLALLRFYEPVTFQPNIIPVCVPENDEDFIGQTAFVTGWGRLYEDGPLPSVLQEVAVPVINNTICESMYRSAGYIEHIPHIFICAGWKKGGYDSCEGDSGGPMVLQRESDKRFQLGGVISWGIGCAEANQPGVYTRISEFRDWINQILQF